MPSFFSCSVVSCFINATSFGRGTVIKLIVVFSMASNFWFLVPASQYPIYRFQNLRILHFHRVVLIHLAFSSISWSCWLRAMRSFASIDGSFIINVPIPKVVFGRCNFIVRQRIVIITLSYLDIAVTVGASLHRFSPSSCVEPPLTR